MKADTARLIELVKQAEEIGKSFVATAVAKKFKNLTDEEKRDLGIVITSARETTLRIIEWRKNGSTFEDWELIFITSNNDEPFMVMDTTGQLREIGEEIKQLDLREYFDTVVSQAIDNPASNAMMISIYDGMLKDIVTK